MLVFQWKLWVSPFAQVSSSFVLTCLIGMLLGDFVDEYTVKVVDVFAMPQSGTAVSVETIDEIFQQEMLELLKATNRSENVVGWYHSHPGFGCWLRALTSTRSQVLRSFTLAALLLWWIPFKA